MAVWSAGCGPSGNPALRSFYASLKPGLSLLDAVREAEKAQQQDVHFSVIGQDCPGAYVSIGRSPGILHIRVTQPTTLSNPSAEPGYSEVGYSTREDFSRGLQEQLPAFYACRKFWFQFGRDQLWPTSDSFTVNVDAKGQITSVSELKEE